MSFRGDIFEHNSTFTIEEAAGDVDGKHVLGKISGCFFVPNGISRNNRYYPQELWEKVISNPDVKKKMTERRMFGTISHTQAIDDVALLEGKISHIITNLKIVNGQGIGEALILDTPAGRVLNTFLRAGSKLFVSSRANGEFKGEENGIPRVDPESYELSGFDVVIDPGFVQANPKLVESLTKLIEGSVEESKIINPTEEFEMKEVLESISRENASLKSDLDKVMKDFLTTKNENTVLGDENGHLKEKFAKMEATIAEQGEKLKKYEALGRPEEIDHALDLTDNKLKKYEALGGTPEELSEMLTKSKGLLESYSKIGTPEKIDEALDKAIAVMKAYSGLGTPAEIDESLERGIETIQAYKEFGSVEELKALFERLEKSAVSMKEERTAKKVSELSKTLNVSEEAVKELWGKLSEESIKAFFAKMNPTPVVAAPVVEKPEQVEAKKVVEKFVKKTPVVEAKTEEQTTEEKKSMFSKTRGQRIMEEFTK